MARYGKMETSIPMYHQSAPGMLSVQSLPRSSGSFHNHQMEVQQSLEHHLRAKGYTITHSDDPSVPLVILYQSQGRIGDELPSGLPQELYGGKRRIILAVIQDDEYTKADRNCLPPGFDADLVINIHVVPGQHSVHSAISGLCERNAQEIRNLMSVVPPGPSTSNPSSWVFYIVLAVPLVLLLISGKPYWAIFGVVVVIVGFVFDRHQKMGVLSLQIVVILCGAYVVLLLIYAWPEKVPPVLPTRAGEETRKEQ